MYKNKLYYLLNNLYIFIQERVRKPIPAFVTSSRWGKSIRGKSNGSIHSLVEILQLKHKDVIIT